MPTLVHLTPEKNIARIRRAVIKPTSRNCAPLAGVYCMPVLPSFFLTYQWLRELKRHSGGYHRTMVGITFRLPSDEPVWVGHYGRERIRLPLGEAIHMIMQQPDARGYELLVPRPITVGELRGVRYLPQIVGWRYQPDAHKRWPCPCPLCLPRGSYRSAGLRTRVDPSEKPPSKPVLMAQLAAATDDAEIEAALRQLATRTRGGPEELAYLLASPSPRVRVALAATLPAYRGPAVRKMLLQLADDPDPTVREEARYSLDQQRFV